MQKQPVTLSGATRVVNETSTEHPGGVVNEGPGRWISAARFIRVGS